MDDNDHNMLPTDSDFKHSFWQLKFTNTLWFCISESKVTDEEPDI